MEVNNTSRITVVSLFCMSLSAEGMTYMREKEMKMKKGNECKVNCIKFHGMHHNIHATFDR